MLAWLWGVLLVGATVFVSIAGTLLVRRWIPVEVLERRNEVAGFIYAVIGVLYAVLLGCTAITVSALRLSFESNAMKVPAGFL